MEGAASRRASSIESAPPPTAPPPAAEKPRPFSARRAQTPAEPTTVAITDEVRAELKATFDLFDLDGSGYIDKMEMFMMMESLGIPAAYKAVSDMIDEEDQDGNGEIDLDELCSIVSRNSGTARGANGVSFGQIFDKKRTSGAPLLFRTDKLGVGIEVKERGRTVCGTGEAWGAQLTEEWFSTKRQSSNTASVLLAVEELHGECYIGVASINMNSKEWNCTLGESKEYGATAPFGGVHCATGELYYKGRKLDHKRVCQILAGDRVAFDMDMHASHMNVRVLRADGPSKDPKIPVTWVEKAHSEFDGLHHEITIAVAFGQTESGQCSRVRLVGSSTQKTAKPGRKEQASYDDVGGLPITEEMKVTRSVET